VKPIDPKRIAREFDEVVNMTPAELRDWLETDMSRAVGWKGVDGARTESVGHASGRQILSILPKSRLDLTADDYAHMRRTVGFIRRHLAQEPENPVTSRWRHSLMNWGHDPLKACLRP
jgi:predicted alpha/beta hydrolase